MLDGGIANARTAKCKGLDVKQSILSCGKVAEDSLSAGDNDDLSSEIRYFGLGVEFLGYKASHCDQGSYS